MAKQTKKTFASGLDNLLTSTTPAVKQPSPKSPPSPKSQPSPRQQPPPDELTSILIRIPIDLKIKLDLHCAANRLSKQSFITSLIEANIG
jgi:hypothetical protein